MIARFLGILMVVVPIGMAVALFWYFLQRKHRRDLQKERKEEK